VFCLVALPHRSFSSSEPRAHFVPFIVRVGESVGLLTAGAFYGLMVRERINLYGSAVRNFDERDHAFRILLAQQDHRDSTKWRRSARAKDAKRRFRFCTRGDCFSEVLTNCVWRARVGG